MVFIEFLYVYFISMSGVKLVRYMQYLHNMSMLRNKTGNYLISVHEALRIA